MPGTGGFGANPLSRERESDQAGTPPPPMGVLPTKFESYEIMRKEDGSLWELGRGAMGITYKAVDVDLQVPVALKVINPLVLGNRDASERFLREARSAARLRHGNIASVFRLGQVDGTHFYAMEFCEGQTVHQLVERRGPLELRLALEITRQVATALIVAQDHGVVHRDIKPSNLMVTGRVPDEFTVKVIDFGLAKHTAPDSAAIDISVASDRAGFVGTAHFASPEQLEDRAVDFRSDIYSLGVTLWFMLSGRPLFEGSLTRVVTQHLAQKPPMEKLGWLPPRITALLDSMLAKDPEDRPASSRQLRDQLQFCLEEASLDVTYAADSSTPPPPMPSSSAARSSRPASSVPPLPASSPSSFAPPPAETRPPAPAPIPQLPTHVPMVPSAMPPTTPPAYNPAPEATTPPARPKPSSNGPIIIGMVLVAFLLLAALGGGYAFNRWGKQLLAPKTTVDQPGQPDQPANATTNNSSPASTPAPPANQEDTRETMRQVRLAQEAAEKLSRDLNSLDKTNELLNMVLNRRTARPEDSEAYRTQLQNMERFIIDDEQQYLISAKRLRKVSPEAYSAAFDQLDKEVSDAGISWRTRVTELIRTHIQKIEPDTVRVDADFRDRLKALQVQ